MGYRVSKEGIQIRYIFGQKVNVAKGNYELDIVQSCRKVPKSDFQSKNCLKFYDFVFHLEISI